MKRIGVIANCDKPRAREVLGRLAEIAGDLGLQLKPGHKTARLLRCAASFREDAPGRGIDALLAVGGDGTMIQVARELNGRDIPVMGVNIGGLGFLTSVTEDDMERAMTCLVAGDFSTSTRAVAECRVKRGRKTVVKFRALNEAMIHNSESARVITLDVSIDGRKAGSYLCDGVIVATPTGSTGHSLSAGGPILESETPAFVISLICPHTLNSRAMVVSDASRIVVEVVDNAGGSRVSVDGQVGQALQLGDRVEVTRSARSVRFIHLPGYSFFSVLRHKLHWRGSNV